MNSESEHLPSPPPSSTPRPRGRPRQTQQENPQQRIERLTREMQQAQDELRISEEKRAGIVGAAAIRHARHNAEFARQLAAMLRAEVKAKADRAAVGDLMIDGSS